jgi:hypothetical protein
MIGLTGVSGIGYVSLLLTGPGRISIEWDVLRREIFPRGKALVQNQKQNAHRV